MSLRYKNIICFSHAGSEWDVAVILATNFPMFLQIQLPHHSTQVIIMSFSRFFQTFPAFSEEWKNCLGLLLYSSKNKEIMWMCVCVCAVQSQNHKKKVMVFLISRDNNWRDEIVRLAATATAMEILVYTVGRCLRAVRAVPSKKRQVNGGGRHYARWININSYI